MYNELTDTTPSSPENETFVFSKATPGLLVAYAVAGSVPFDRCPIKTPFCIGRSAECDMTIRDTEVSKFHLTIMEESGKFFLHDQGSMNGTYLNGLRIIDKEPIRDGDIIRVGRAVLVFHIKANKLVMPRRPPRFGFVGGFHTALVVDELKLAAHSSRHILLAGPSGSGKELAADALAVFYGDHGAALPILAHNAARFSSEEEAASTLFGVAPRVFSNVDARPGLIESAKNGVLFLDEIHNLPARVQRTLLRTIEDGFYSRIGETKARATEVRFVFASNQSPPDYGLAHDLLARLRVMNLPSLKERIADIPEIFVSLLEKELRVNGISSLDTVKAVKAVNSAHFEAMCLDGFQSSNVRGIIDTIDNIISRLCADVPPKEAIQEVFSERFGRGPVGKRYVRIPKSTPQKAAPSGSKYEVAKQQIIATYLQCNGNISETERALKRSNFPCTRKWLAHFIKVEWRIKTPPKGSRKNIPG